MATAAPSHARRSAIARPIPSSPPSTAVTLPFSGLDTTRPIVSFRSRRAASRSKLGVNDCHTPRSTSAHTVTSRHVRGAACCAPTNSASGDGYFRAQINVLNCIQQLNAFLQWPLKCLPAGDQSGAACPFVDHRGDDGFLEVIRAGSSPAVDQTSSPHEAIRYRVAAKVDAVIAGKFGVI